MIKKSRKELTTTVNTLNEFIGEIEEESKIEIEVDKKAQNQVEESKLSEKTRDFLKIILTNNFIEKEKAQQFAVDEGVFLNVFINEINDELFPYINDQSLVIEEDKIVIDDFYIDMVKELVDE